MYLVHLVMGELGCCVCVLIAVLISGTIAKIADVSRYDYNDNNENR